ncbi:MAG: PepSY-associated TM helix domain-containing protein [Steroidobacteraceae bacterium]
MLKKILTQSHWLLGITLGTFLAFSALTGALMAFGPELTMLFQGGYQRIDAQPSGQLDPVALYSKVRADHPERTPQQLLMFADTQRPAVVKFAALPGGTGPMGPHPQSRVLNPYTGELLPEKTLGTRVEWFMTWLREIHQGHWGAPGGFYKVIATLIGLATVMLFFMALSGLYLRWPKGIAARKWQTWFKLNTKLKGRAFLWNLHTVLGTAVLLVYLVFAHSGAFQNGEMSWYGSAVRSVLGVPQQVGPPGGAGPGPGGMAAGMGGGPGPAQGAGPGPGSGMSGGPPQGGFAPGMQRGPMNVRVYFMTEDSYINADGTVVNAKSAQIDVARSVLMNQTDIAKPATLGASLAANNQNIHEGRIFGKAGVLVMMVGALCMPVFYVSGWMMYLDRRRRKKASAK